MIGSDDEDDHQDHGSWQPEPPLGVPAAEEAATTFDLLVEEMPRGAAPGARPVRTPLVQLTMVTPPSSPDDRCLLPQPFQALTLRMIMAPSPVGPHHPPGLVQDFDKKVDKIRQLSSFECRVVGGPTQAKKLAGFLAHLTDRHKAAKLKGDGWLPGTYAFLTPQPLGPGDTVWLHQFVPPSAAAPPAPVAPAPAAAPVAAPAPALNESKKRPRSPLPTTPTGGATGGGVFVPHSPESAPPPTTTTTSNGTGAAAGLRTHQQAGSGGDEETTLAARPPSPPGLPPPRPPSPPGYPPGHPACSSFAAGAAVAAGTAAGPNAGAGQNTPDGDHLVSRPSSPQGFPPPRPSSPSGLPPGASAPQPVAFAPHSPESAPPAPPTSSASLPSGQQPPPQPQQPLPCWSVGRPPSPEHAPPGWRGPTLKRGELPPPFPQQAQQTPLPQSQPPQQQQQQAQPCLSPLAVPPRTSSSMQAAPPQPSQVATSTAASSSWGSDQQTAANAYSKLVRTQDTMALSRMYHMRRLNNCIKDALLGGAVHLGAGTRGWGQPPSNPALLLPQHPSSSTSSASASAAADANMGAVRAATSAASGGLRVLDLACGKAGDWSKWNKAAKSVPGGLQRYVGVDIARGSLDDALERVQESGLQRHGTGNGSSTTVRLALVNLGETKMEDYPSEVWESSAHLPQWSNAPALTRATDCLFHVASMQFALHYMFESLRRARGFFQDLGSWLAPGGCFVCTTVDARVMVDLLMEQAQPEWKDAAKQWVLRIHDPHGTSSSSGSGGAVAAAALAAVRTGSTSSATTSMGNTGLPPPPDDAASRLQRLQAKDRLYRSNLERHRHDSGNNVPEVEGSAEIPAETISSNAGVASSATSGATTAAGDGAASAIDVAEAVALSKSEEDVTAARKQALCTITFADDVYQRLLKPSGGHSVSSSSFSNVAGRGAGATSPALSDHQLESMLGLRYAFKLFDGEDAAAVDAPEWLVPLPLLTILANEAGLDLDFATNFQDYVRSGAAWNLPQHKWVPAVPPSVLASFGVFNHKGTLSGPEWATSRLYQVLQFTKRAPAPAAATVGAVGTSMTQGGGGGNGSSSSSSNQMSEGQLRMTAMKAVKAALGAEGFKALGAQGQKQAIQNKLEELKAARGL